MSHKNKTRKDKESNKLPPIPPVLDEGYPSNDKGDSGKYNHDTVKKFFRPEMMTAIFTAVIAIWTVIYSIFAGLQWWEIHQGGRPWVGLRDFKCEGCTSDQDGTLVIGSMFGVMENTGKTPAVQMIVSAVWTDRKGADPIPDYDSIKREVGDPYAVPNWLPPEDAARIAKTMEITKRYTEPAVTVLPPNSTRILPIMGGAKMGRNQRAFLEDRKIFYVVGKITYFSTEQDKQFITKFCLMNEFSSNFRFCPAGNVME